MITIRSFLLLFSCLVLLSACAAYTDVPCPLPGPTQMSTCYYFLTITDKVPKEDGSYEVRGQVAKAAVEYNLAHLGWLESAKIENYRFFSVALKLERLVVDKVKVGEDRWFQSVKGTDRLTDYTPSGETLEIYKTTVPWDSPTAK
jgi:hypothetical protein